MRRLDTSGPTSLATVELESGGSSYVRLFVRDDGVVIARPIVETDVSFEQVRAWQDAPSNTAAGRAQALSAARPPELAALCLDMGEALQDAIVVFGETEWAKAYRPLLARFDRAAAIWRSAGTPLDGA